VRVEFSELALKGLQESEPDPDKRESIWRSIRLHLSQADAFDKSRLLDVRSGNTLYVYPIYKWRVMWEQITEARFVWSITPSDE